MNIGLIQKTLNELASSVQNLSNEEYSQSLLSLSGSSIGEHARHIIEFFQELFNGYEQGLIHYDARQRNVLIQSNPQVAVEHIQRILSQIERPDKLMKLKTSLIHTDEHLSSNYFRELCYCWEHCIHHQAMIKVGFLELNKSSLDASFGVAISTLSYRDQCAQ